uniref:Ferric oxidoreductase domain-containing protein n=1 Tax=Tetradesmus obliquus TaxID=3088 RepID=A0A383W8R5_TETOB|eukprot:jgi/Sobl393_1/11654/SZX73509.1
MVTWLLYAGTPFWRYSSSFSSNLAFLVVAPALLALSSLGIVVLQPMCSKAQQHASIGIWRRVAAHLLPPRRFWQRSLGGVSVQDLSVLCFLVAVNAIWATALLLENWRQLPALQGYSAPTKATLVKMVAESLGGLLAPNLVLLLYPITRGSVMLQALRLPYPEAIRYHRWVGHHTWLLVLLHCIMYYAAWGYEGIFVAKAFAQGSKANGLFGGMAFLLSMAMWVACNEAVRRQAYAMFKTLHHVGFYAFLVLGCCHYWQMIWWCLPGLVLYFLEVALRLWQAACSNEIRVLHASASSDSKLCSLVLSAPQHAAASSGIVWLHAPGIGWFSTWHPFDYVTVPWPAGKRRHNGSKRYETAILVNMKAFDGWTAKFIARVAQQGVKTSVKMQGPYADVGSPVIDGCGTQLLPAAAAAGQRSSQEPSGAIIIAGGVSITPAMAVLQELAASSAPQKPVLLLWSFRQRHELELLCPPLLALAGALRLSLTTRLFYTGPMSDLQPSMPLTGGKLQQLQLAAAASNPAAVPGHQQLPDSAANADAAVVKALQQNDDASPAQAVVNIMTDPDTDASDTESSTNQKGCSASQPGAAEAAAERTAAAGASEPGLKVSPLAPGVSMGSFSGQAWLQLLLLAAGYAGALAAVLLGHYIIFKTHPEPLPTNQAGALITALVAAAVLLPAAAILALALLLGSRTATGEHSSSSSNCSCDKAAVQGGFVTQQAGGRAALQAGAAAAAAEAVQQGSCAKLVSSSSGTLQLELPAMHGVAAMDSSNVLQVTAGRPQLQPLIENWLTMLKQLPKAADSNESEGGKEQQKASGSQPLCAVYAMGPAPLVADAQVLSGGMKGVHFVQKTYTL